MEQHNSQQGGTNTTRYSMRLYVAGDAANSRIAQDNLERLRERLTDHDLSVEIVDVNTHPDVALQENVFITPALQIIEPKPGGMVYGNLSDLETLRRFLPSEA